jgi:hypothetical protein
MKELCCEVKSKRKLLDYIRKRQSQFLAHIMKWGSLENIVTTARLRVGEIEGDNGIIYMFNILVWNEINRNVVVVDRQKIGET